MKYSQNTNAEIAAAKKHMVQKRTFLAVFLILLALSCLFLNISESS